jgi:ComF family protein
MLFDRVLEYLFPARCLGCNTPTGPGRAACEPCLAGVRMHATLFCGSCKSRLPGGKRTCHPSFPYLLGAATDYETPLIRALVHGLKFENVTDAAKPLGALLVRYLESLPPFAHFTDSNPSNAHAFTVVPVPLGARRLRERGFNQAELIAAAAAEHFGFPLGVNVLVRTQNTPAQSAKENFEERHANVRGCFALADTAALRSERVLLIDDVTTSGATLFEAATVLRKARVRTVIACAVARAG